MVSKSAPASRTAKIERSTKETQIRVALDLDGTGKAQFDTKVPFLEHMLEQIALHGMFDLDVTAKGDLHIDGHHTVEDIGICLGQAFAQALVDKSGLNRYGHAYVPLDEALSRAVIDLSGRPGLSFNVQFKRSVVGQFDLELLREFFQAFVNHSMITMHLDNLAGENAHHQAETLFKALGRALRMAVAPDHRRANASPSTKGVL